MHSDSILNNKYTIHKKLGSGAFGKVYLGRNIYTKEYVAIKTEKIIEPVKTKYDNTPLTREFKVYKRLKKENEHKKKEIMEILNKSSFHIDPSNVDTSNLINIPKIFDFYRNDKKIITIEDKQYHKYQQYMVMELMGPNLEKLFDKNHRKFPYINVCSMGYQMIKLIEYIHNIGWLHRDIKPENFVVGYEEKNQKKVYLLDFGLSRKWEELVDKYNDFYTSSTNSIVGTARYMSINVHKGLPYSWRDDLESIGYVLIYFVKGRLPWQGLKKKDNKSQMKSILDVKIKSYKTLCDDLPRELKDYMEYCWNLRIDDAPNYVYLKQLFLNKVKKLSVS